MKRFDYLVTMLRKWHKLKGSAHSFSEAADELERLRVSFMKYADHLPACGTERTLSGRSVCSCGLTEEKRRLTTGNGGKE